MIKKLTVKLKSGTLTEFDSDTTMGIFCWRLKDALGEEKLKSFLERYKAGNPVFTISNALFEIKNTLFFPTPVFIQSEYKKQSKKENIESMLRSKEAKSRNFVSLQRFNALLNHQIDDFMLDDEPLFEGITKKVLLSPGFESELRVGVMIDRETEKSKDGQLFSLHPRYLKKGNNLVFLIKVVDSDTFNEFKCEDILHDVFTVGYGKKKSSGYGHCMVINKIEDFNGIVEPENSNGFIALGNYLPAESDQIAEGYYDVKVKYGKLGESLATSKVPFKKPILMITQGSYFKTGKTKPWYGRITNEGEISELNPFAVQFGTPFTLNCKLP